MRIGIAIPCFIKHIPYCMQLLDELEFQTRKPDEVVVSCSSTTEFPKKQYSFLVKIITTEKKQNASTNRNIAASNLTTDIICFFDADDSMHPQRLEILENTFNDGTDIVLHDRLEGPEQCEQEFKHLTTFMKQQNVLKQSPSGCLECNYNWRQRITYGHVSVSKEIYAQIKFPENPAFETREDCVFCYRVIGLPGIRSVYLPYALSKYIPSFTCVSEREKI